ncbi:hypothetical protein JCM1840_007631 [Sporobolomyces johnsonii]
MPSAAMSLHTSLSIQGLLLHSRHEAIMWRVPKSESCTILKIEDINVKAGELEVTATTLNGINAVHNTTRIDPALQAMLYGVFFSKATPSAIPHFLDVVRDCHNALPLVVLGTYYLSFTSLHLATSGSARLTHLQHEWDNFIDVAIDGHLHNESFDTGYTTIRRSARLQNTIEDYVTPPSPPAPNQRGRSCRTPIKRGD